MKNARQRGAALAITLALGFSMIGAAPAVAATGGGSGAGSTSADLQDEIAAIPLSGLRALVEQRITTLTAKGATIESVGHSEYVPAAGGGVSLMAFPSNCGAAILAYRSGNTMKNDMLTYCSTGSWSANTIRQRIVAKNSYLPTDYRTVLDTAQTIGASSNWSRYVSHVCKGAALTNYEMFGRSTIVYGGSSSPPGTPHSGPAAGADGESGPTDRAHQGQPCRTTA